MNSNAIIPTVILLLLLKHECSDDRTPSAQFLTPSLAEDETHSHGYRPIQRITDITNVINHNQIFLYHPQNSRNKISRFL